VIVFGFVFGRNGREETLVKATGGRCTLDVLAVIETAKESDDIAAKLKFTIAAPTTTV